MHPHHHAQSHADRPVAIMAETGATLTYGELERRANQGAHLLRSLGIKAGESISVMIENDLSFFELYWAAQRSGVYFTPISTKLTADEVAYIVNDSDSRLLVVGSSIPVAAELVAQQGELMPNLLAIMSHPDLPGARSWPQEREAMPATLIDDPVAGIHMFYSSGTTGRPKGVRLPFAGGAFDAPSPYAEGFKAGFGSLLEGVYLSPAPLYHAAPLVFSTVIQRFGGTVVAMKKFDPEALLAAIEKYKVNFVQMVPTMFVRLLKLPEDVRNRYDVSSLKYVAHGAAPCPVEVKRAMIEWWGPIIHEYYSGSEGNGSTAITSQEWLQKPGSVGKAQYCTIHICDDDGNELPPNTPGAIYFEGGYGFSYHKDEAKSQSARNSRHPTWTTLGDVGYLDEDGYLFLTDRKAYMIISGGVNIYPQEAENLLISHPKVADVAVIGVPDQEMGEAVKAVVQPADWSMAGPELEAELIGYCRDRLSHVKCPKSVDFDPELPRHDTGKLYKRLIQDRYWQGHDKRIAG
jgi:long-chain acyl-CoA synthetase